MKFLSTILALAIPSVVFAQSNYHSGYIIKNNNDTVKGYINYQEWNKNPHAIDFKNSLDSKSSNKFTPANIKCFHVDEMETYIAYQGKISTDATALTTMSDHLDTTKRIDSVFLRQITAGKNLMLYSYRDDIKLRFFVAGSGEKPVELKYAAYRNEDGQIVYSTFYKGQLILYAKKFQPENENLLKQIERTEYNDEDLGSSIDAINGNSLERVKKKVKNRLFVGISLNRTNTEVDDAEYSGLTQNQIMLTPKVNFGIDIFDNPNVQRLVFRVEGSLSYINPEFKSTRASTWAATDVNTTYSFNQYTFAITPQLLFNVYNRDNLKVYLDGGIAFNFSAYSNNKVLLADGKDIYFTQQTINKPYKLETTWVSFPLQAGVTLNRKIELFASYAFFGTYSKYTIFYASNQSTNLGVRYLFGMH